jgi:hypothetical protein
MIVLEHSAVQCVYFSTEQGIVGPFIVGKSEQDSAKIQYFVRSSCIKVEVVEAVVVMS